MNLCRCRKASRTVSKASNLEPREQSWDYRGSVSKVLQVVGVILFYIVFLYGG